MKRIIVMMAAAMALCSTVFAQGTGNKYFGVSLDLTTGKMEMEANTSSESRPLDKVFGLNGEFGYFLDNRIKLGIALGYSHASEPTEERYDGWYESKTNLLSFSPNIGYYIKLRKGLYYNPEFGISLLCGSADYEDSNGSEKFKVKGVDLYMKFPT